MKIRHALRFAAGILGLTAAIGVAMVIPGRIVEAAPAPKVGETAPDFELSSVAGEKVRLSKLALRGPVVMIVLRGYPGYQCPICNGQVGEFLGRAREFQAAKANVVLIYPGPSDALKQHASEFVRGKTMPENFHLLIDPDYTVTDRYGLRWDEPRETAYPSTFVIGTDREVRFAKISRSHGGRSKASEVIEALTR
ncbi:peroxiredoxin family protein [Singulisphaera rosea]